MPPITAKKVTVVVELQARFDEEANIHWAKRLTEAGVHVIFSAPGLKIHAKLFLISRKEGDDVVRYAHIGTGNFNEKTARLYTDYSLLTADARITNEVRRVFNFIENPYRPVTFDYLMVSPQNSRRLLYEMIDREIANAQQGLPSGITLKLNNLVDKGLVDRLYAASGSGVQSICWYAVCVLLFRNWKALAIIFARLASWIAIWNTIGFIFSKTAVISKFGSLQLTG